MDTNLKQSGNNSGIETQLLNTELLCFFPDELNHQAVKQFEAIEKEMEVQHA